MVTASEQEPQFESQTRDELIAGATDRLMRLTRGMKKNFPRVARWEQTDDVFQNAVIRLYRALKDVEVESPLHFYRLAALQIRRELLDLSRKHRAQGPGWAGESQVIGFDRQGEGKDPVFDVPDSLQESQAMFEWDEFHRVVELLKPEEKEVFDLMWYAGLTQHQVAKALDVSVKTIQRRWRSARLSLSAALGDVETHVTQI